MDKISDYIFVTNVIPENLCKSLIDECNKKEWEKHTWYNNTIGEALSDSTKELDVMACTQDQQNKITPYLMN